MAILVLALSVVPIRTIASVIAEPTDYISQLIAR